jgi:hypothetical protein
MESRSKRFRFLLPRASLVTLLEVLVKVTRNFFGVLAVHVVEEVSGGAHLGLEL